MTRTAEEWIARLRAGDVTEEERAAFAVWLESDSERKLEYIKCRDAESMTSRLREAPELLGDELEQRLTTLRSRSVRRSSRRWFVPAALAASVALVALLVGVSLPPRTTAREAAATRHGEQREIKLADGSTVTLNTGSDIEWLLTDSKRQVTLKSGEAYFDVAREVNRPFIVLAGTSEVRVVGTQFSVRLEGEKTEVIVREGRVQMVPVVSSFSFLQSKVELTPGNRVRVYEGADKIQVAAVDADRLTAWRNGSLEFDGNALEEVVAEVNRYADVPLVIGDRTIASQRISGRVRVGDLDTVRFLLRERFEIDSTTQGGSILLKRSAK